MSDSSPCPFPLDFLDVRRSFEAIALLIVDAIGRIRALSRPRAVKINGAGLKFGHVTAQTKVANRV